MRLLWLLLVPPWIFLVCVWLGFVIKFAADNEKAWWGGLPLWMAVAIPSAVIGVFGLVALVGFAFSGAH